MRKTNAFAATAIVALLFGMCSLSHGAAPVEFFDFSGWDDSMIQGGGQTFNDICGDIDVTVTAIGSFTSTSGAGTMIQTHHADPASSSLRFTFSAPLQLAVGMLTVDGNEVHSVYTSATESYAHEMGAAPNVSFPAGGISVAGTAFGISATGAANGLVSTDGLSSLLTLTYEARPNTPALLQKYGQWRVGKVIPEPNSIALLGIGGLGMLLQLRKRK